MNGRRTTNGPAERRSSPAAVAAWLWVVAATLAYLWQFAGYVRPILTLLG